MGGDELRLITQAFDANYVAPAGAMLDRFEQDLITCTGIPHCVAVSSGTAALQLILHHYDIGRDDRVWVCSLTFIGGVSAIIHRGAIPVFLDCDESYTLDTALLAEALENANRTNSLPKALITTDLFGQPANLPEIVKLCRPYGIKVISDSAESLGSKQADGHHAGFGADAVLLSFNGNKIITTSGGGAVLSDDRSLVDHCRKLATQAREPVLHYEHKEVGYNFRLSNISAAIGVGQMRILDDRVQKRRAIFDAYQAGLPGLEMMPECFGATANRWLSVAQVKTDSNALIDHLAKHQIEARPVWKPMHLQPVFKDAETLGGAVSETLYRNGICLPSASQMDEEQQQQVISIIKTGSV